MFEESDVMRLCGQLVMDEAMLTQECWLQFAAECFSIDEDSSDLHSS